ncbi:uncharacterized protein LOC126284906 [Schistocerca gregaria]|uniref:uncharacterized protein LOC126284906 n=1 Tax=Schistocerca gregaria TaxID=7010 RepID=UPI00211DFB1D|nr:uncharacterized protein LOC126284906 [Schistocerca gregaria]
MDSLYWKPIYGTGRLRPRLFAVTAAMRLLVVCFLVAVPQGLAQVDEQLEEAGTTVQLEEETDADVLSIEEEQEESQRIARSFADYEEIWGPSPIDAVDVASTKDTHLGKVSPTKDADRFDVSPTKASQLMNVSSRTQQMPAYKAYTVAPYYVYPYPYNYYNYWPVPYYHYY